MWNGQFHGASNSFNLRGLFIKYDLSLFQPVIQLKTNYVLVPQAIRPKMVRRRCFSFPRSSSSCHQDVAFLLSMSSHWFGRRWAPRRWPWCSRECWRLCWRVLVSSRLIARSGNSRNNNKRTIRCSEWQIVGLDFGKIYFINWMRAVYGPEISGFDSMQRGPYCHWDLRTDIFSRTDRANKVNEIFIIWLTLFK